MTPCVRDPAPWLALARTLLDATRSPYRRDAARAVDRALRTCTCGARRGQGHALLCSRVWGDHPGVYYAPAPGTDDEARVLHHDHHDHDHHEAL